MYKRQQGTVAELFRSGFGGFHHDLPHSGHFEDGVVAVFGRGSMHGAAAGGGGEPNHAFVGMNDCLLYTSVRVLGVAVLPVGSEYM